MFAEWASATCTPPDTATIEKHVNAMVDAVFKHYDNDRDGYISREEFDSVNTNFPFIASFCVLDADQYVSIYVRGEVRFRDSPPRQIVPTEHGVTLDSFSLFVFSDGMISKLEMKKYFIHANCHALKSLKNGFKHDFHETTYFKPTFCAHCAGLVS